MSEEKNKKKMDKKIMISAIVLGIAAGGLLGWGIYALTGESYELTKKGVPEDSVTIDMGSPTGVDGSDDSKELTTSELQERYWNGYIMDLKEHGIASDKLPESYSDLDRDEKSDMMKTVMSNYILSEFYDKNIDYEFYQPFAEVDSNGKVLYIQTSPLRPMVDFDTSLKLLQDAVAVVPGVTDQTEVQIMYGNMVLASNKEINNEKIYLDEEIPDSDGVLLFHDNYQFTSNDKRLYESFVENDVIGDYEAWLDADKNTVVFDAKSSRWNQPDNKAVALLVQGTVGVREDAEAGSIKVTAPSTWADLTQRDREQFYYQVFRLLAPFVYERQASTPEDVGVWPNIEIVHGEKVLARNFE